MHFCARLAAPRRRLVELSTLTAKTTYTTPSPGRQMLSWHALPSVLPISDQRQPAMFQGADYACTGTIIENRQFSCRPGRPTWTSETLLLGQAAPQGRKAELRPSVPALGAPAASALVQRSGHRRSGCGQFHAAVCSVCSGTCTSHGCWLRVEDARCQDMHSTPSPSQRLSIVVTTYQFHTVVGACAGVSSKSWCRLVLHSQRAAQEAQLRCSAHSHTVLMEHVVA